MEQVAAIPDRCERCGVALLSIHYFGVKGEPVGGYRVCANCGPRSVVDITTGDVRRALLERKAS